MELVSQEEQKTSKLVWSIKLDDGRTVTVTEWLRDNGKVDDTEMWADDGSDLSEGDETSIEAFIDQQMSKQPK